MTRKRPWYLNAYLLLSVPLLLCCVIVQRVWFPDALRGKPTGSSLVATFDQQRVALETLQAMMAEDQSLAGIGMLWTRPSPASATGLSRERLQAYRRLMKQAGIEDIQRSPEMANDVPLKFQVYGQGTLGTQFGYLYTQGSVYDTHVESPDSLDLFTGVARLLFKLDENWYIYYRDAG